MSDKWFHIYDPQGCGPREYHCTFTDYSAACRLAGNEFVIDIKAAGTPPTHFYGMPDSGTRTPEFR